MFPKSLPSRGRGLKWQLRSAQGSLAGVAPLAGAWVEIVSYRRTSERKGVAPLAGAWVEIYCNYTTKGVLYVAPLAGAWVEIYCKWRKRKARVRRSPRGGVG